MHTLTNRMEGVITLSILKQKLQFLFLRNRYINYKIYFYGNLFEDINVDVILYNLVNTLEVDLV
jgi:hypothetical protein